LRFQVAGARLSPQPVEQVGQLVTGDGGQAPVGAEFGEEPVQHAGVAAAGIRVGAARRGQEGIDGGLDGGGVAAA
jgi:hypothetical protein